MSARSFRSVFMVASCAGAALGCYLVSLRVASERAALQEVESKIVMAERDIRLLQTEIGTRGRLAQLERWNVKVLALSAPNADQFLEGGFALARLIRPDPKPVIEAPVVLASASADAPRPQVAGAAERQPGNADTSATADELLHVASLKHPLRPDVAPAPEAKPARAAAEPRQSVEKKAVEKPRGPRSTPVTKPVWTAKIDPLAPLPEPSSKKRKDAVSAR
jgi:hypothetical protein